MRPLREARDAASFGGKAAQLAEALQLGLPVPDGFALVAAEVEQIARGGELQPLPAGRWAVRSSAVGEDSDDASFAGQHATVLHVTGERLSAAVRRVWESGREPAALAYRRRMGIATPPRMGVVVQRMVFSEIAGVLFTRHPVTGARERLIEAAWGLGEIVVSGMVTPDTYRLAPSGEVLERRPGHKDIAIHHHEGSEGGTREVAVDPELREALCLDDDQLRALHELAGRVEQSFAGEHDIEWAIEGESVYLLQRRAITT